MNNDNHEDQHKEQDKETISWTLWNRSSKLKKRRRIMSPGRNYDAASIISTAITTTTSASTSNSITNPNTDSSTIGTKVPPLPSTFLQLPFLSQLQQQHVPHHLGERLAAELEYWMNFNQEQQHVKKKERITHDDCAINTNNMAPFSSHLSFPPKSKRFNIQHDLSMGSSVSKDDISFPTRGTLMRTNNKYGILRIVSLNGATIRRECDIHDTSSPIIGKLPYQALRCFVEKQWLSPPPDEDFGHVQRVLRYKIMLMDGDGSTDEDCIYGWISDRSRLEDDPYVIADCIVDI